jgi:dihydrolipoamide dehydrogenase
LKCYHDNIPHRESGEAHLIGPGAADLISQVAIAMEASMICEDFARICHPYPVWSAALRQAAMAAGGWMMHA